MLRQPPAPPPPPRPHPGASGAGVSVSASAPVFCPGVGSQHCAGPAQVQGGVCVCQRGVLARRGWVGNVRTCQVQRWRNLSQE